MFVKFLVYVCIFGTFDLLKPANYCTFHEKNQGYFGDLSHLKFVENTGDWSHILLFMEIIQKCGEIIDFY